MSAKTKEATGRPSVVVRSSESGRFLERERVFSDVKMPGLGKVQIMDRDTYEKASRKAGSAFKTVIGGRHQDEKPVKSGK